MWQQILLQVVQDSPPKLGGDLDVNGKQIVSSSNADIVVKPNGSGKGRLGNRVPKHLAAGGGTNCHSDNDENGELFNIVDR